MEKGKLFFEIYKSIILTVIAVTIVFLSFQLSKPLSRLNTIIDRLVAYYSLDSENNDQHPNYYRQTEEQAKDAVVSDCTNLGAMAQQYFRKPASMGGGGNSFVDWGVPTNLDTTANGYYYASNVTASEVTIIGLPHESLDYTWKVVTTVTETKVSSDVVTN